MRIEMWSVENLRSVRSDERKVGVAKQTGQVVE